MELKEAKELIVFEGLHEDGLVTDFRKNSFPNETRLRKLVDAAEVLRDVFSSSKTIERSVAHAIYCLGFHTQGHLSAQISDGREVPDYLCVRMSELYDHLEAVLEVV